MYTFVADKLDVVYLSAIPENHALQDFDVPEEELEIREIVEVWYECAFLPDFNLEQIDIANKAELVATQTQVVNNYTSTLAFLLKSKVYRAALNRMLSIWTLEPSAKAQLELLLFAEEQAKTN
ncbi:MULTISPECIES: hypothetical protein [Vibrio]|uniref:Uncharacterized protein n=1 Tax=Vibrio owensii TaxID=696485 RepID=A0AAU9Q583_9VIBR|nr:MULTISPECIES: hypothetical protein [Vibrio]AQW60194.1 hypothetical protein A9237_19355 [Vibrio owensii]EKO3869471.1 hypothetical protein [Vibrio harveyi]ELV8722181.1 hypothetical protein [Vibrio harveyi]ELV8771016.1 hypothetical protein [Vibrio harveyi]ELY1985295.1 hypothetical protein [Vibrio harveyi]